MPTATVLSHDWIAHELGHLEPWLERHGFTVDRRYREDGVDLPPADLLIVLGSPESVARGHVEARARREIDAVSRWLADGRPYLGICFGAQELAVAKGGHVRRMPGPFHEYTPLTRSGPSAHVLIGRWTVWHNDAIVAPPHADVLGSLDHADLVFRSGRAWGLQSHVEVTADILQRMAISLGATAEVYEPIVAAVRDDAAGGADRAGALLDAFLDDVSRDGVE